MKVLPKQPYIDNLYKYYINHNGSFTGNNYLIWLRQWGFSAPVRGPYLEFRDDFSDEDLLAFKLKWG